MEGFLHCIGKSDVPLFTIHIDHLGPMDTTGKQYKYVLAMVDAFTKFVWLYTTKTTGAEEVIKKITEWSSVFGAPCRMVSDRGPAFTSNAFGEFVKEQGIQHILTTTGVPRGNGQIERTNRTILAIIGKLSSDVPNKWYKFVPQVQQVINTHIQSTTRKSPFELMFGIKMRGPLHTRIREILEEETFYNFDKDRDAMRDEAKQQIILAQQQYTKKLRPKTKKR